MKTNKIIATAALALLATACTKDDLNRLSIFAEGLNGGAKVLFNPSNLDASSWVAGESIDLNGTPYAIAQDSHDDTYYIDNDGTLNNVTKYAVYPATVSDGGNDIAVTNLGSANCAVAIHKLAVNFVGNDGLHKVYFPMAAKAESNSRQLFFRHLTGGLRLTLANTSESPITVDTIKVGATNNDGPAIWKNLRPNADDWEGWNPGALPAMPGGEIGESNVDHNALFVREMTLVMQTNGNAHVTIPAHGNIVFCIPLLADSVRTISVKGYNGSTPLFSKEKNLETVLAIERNNMYNIPTIEIE